jgi:hypothetical protein
MKYSKRQLPNLTGQLTQANSSVSRCLRLTPVVLQPLRPRTAAVTWRSKTKTRPAPSPGSKQAPNLPDCLTDYLAARFKAGHSSPRLQRVAVVAGCTKLGSDAAYDRCRLGVCLCPRHRYNPDRWNSAVVTSIGRPHATALPSRHSWFHELTDECRSCPTAKRRPSNVRPQLP